MKAFTYLESQENLIGLTERDALFSFDKPTIVRVKGKDSTKAVLISVLLHGCEPAGFRAFLKEINKGREYSLDIFFLIGNIRSAQIEPIFSSRLVSGRQNYNRIWVDDSVNTKRELTKDELIAKEMFDFLKTLPIIAHLDLHSFNAKTTPPHAIIPNMDEKHLNFSKKLCKETFVFDIGGGDLISRTAKFGPSCVIECGTNNSSEADEFAYQTVERFLIEFGLIEGSVDSIRDSKVIFGVTNIKLRPEFSASWAKEKQDADLTLREDVSDLNIKVLSAKTFLGWADSLDVFLVKDKTGMINPNEIFILEEGKLYTKMEVVPDLLAPKEWITKESGFYFFTNIRDA
jgi:hypothetical protein